MGPDGTIYFGSGPARDTGSSLVQAVDPTGSPRWETGLDGSDGSVDDGLAVLADDSMVVPIRGLGMARIYRGEVVATASFYGGSVVGPVAVLGAVHAGTLTGGVLLLDPRTLAVRGRADLPTNVFSVALGRDGLIYARSAERAVSASRFRASSTTPPVEVPAAEPSADGRGGYLGAAVMVSLSGLGVWALIQRRRRQEP